MGKGIIIYEENILQKYNDPNLSVYCLYKPRQIIRLIHKVTQDK